MKRVILGALMASVLASSAMAGHYKPGHSQEGYNETYEKLVNIATVCGATGLIPVASSACGADTLAEVNSQLFKVHMTSKWRKKVKILSGTTIGLTTLLFGSHGPAMAIMGLASEAAEELRTKENAKYIGSTYGVKK